MTTERTKTGGFPRAALRGLPAVLCALLAYLPLTWAGLVWDDKIVQNTQLPHFKTLRDAFFFPADPEAVPHFLYRPLVWVSYMVDRAVSTEATAPSVSHSMNLLFHATAAFLVYLLGRVVFGGEKRAAVASALAALLFAVNPATMDSVASIAGRTDVLATIFVLSALLVFSRWALAGREGPVPALKHGAAAALLWLMGILSKEVAITFFALAPLLGYWLWRGRGARFRLADAAAFAAPFAAAAGVWLALRAGAGVAVLHPMHSGLSAYLTRGLAALGFYVQKAVFPWPWLILARDLPALGVSLAVLAAALGVTAWPLIRGGRSRDAALSAWGWFLAAIAPSIATAFVPFVMTPVAERYLYLPLVSVSLALGWLAAIETGAAGWSRRAPLAIALVLSVAWGGTVLARTKHWQNDIAYWKAAAEAEATAGESFVWTNYGKALQWEGEIEQAVFCYRKARALAREQLEKLTADHALGVALVKYADPLPPARKLTLATEAAEILDAFAARNQRKGLWGNLALARYYKVESTYNMTGVLDRNELERSVAAARRALHTEPDDRQAAEVLAAGTELLGRK